jgi:adenine deaminase
MQILSNVALGVDKADIVISNGTLVDVYSGALLQNYSVAIKGEWIAAIGRNLERTKGKDTYILDACGKIIAPGFIEGHTHLNYLFSPENFLRQSMAGGTTTIITESGEIIYTAGLKGLLQLLESWRAQPIKVYATIPPPLNLGKSGRAIWPSIAQMKNLLRREDIVGVGESYWQMVLSGNDHLPPLAEEALKLGKTVEGHTAGAHDEKLMAYLAYGINSCHEPVSVEDVLERLRLGVFVMIRQGSIREELDAMVKLKDMRIDFSRISLVTDGMDPRDLVKRGYLESAVQKAIDLGFDFIRAIQMVTINPATHFRLDHFTGGIAPGKHADIVILPDMQKIKPEYVLSKGKIIAQHGKLLVPPRKTQYKLPGLTKLPKHVSTPSLIIHAPVSGQNKVRVMDMVTDLVSREYITEMPSVTGMIQPDPDRDILKITLLGLKNKIVNALIRGIGLKDGAVASSYIWETYGIIAVGTNDNDIAKVINHIIQQGGGIAVCAHGSITTELPLPIAGIITSKPMSEVAQRQNEIQREVERLGCKVPDIVKTISVLPSAAIPFLRITEDGLIDLKSGKVTSLFATS